VSSHAGLSARALDPVVTLPPARVRWLLPLALGAALAAATLIAKGGTSLAPATYVEIAVVLVGAAVAIAALLLAPTPQRRWGGITLVLLAALAAWTALSISWAITPDVAWTEANRTVAYVAAFAGAIGIARLAPEHGRSILTAVLVACLTICVIGLFKKAFPAVTNSTAELARLREPLGYWNALGALAAMAAPACLWLAARRTGHTVSRALGYPLLGLTLVTLLFSYSRGALVALVLALVFWFAVVPLRLRALTVLLVSGIGAGAVTAWAFFQDALSKDGQPLAARIAAGHTLAVVLLLMLVLLFAAGLAIEWASSEYTPAAGMRRAIGIAALSVALLLPVAGVFALALSQRGLPGTVSQAWNSFFSTSATSPGYGPERLGTTSSKRGAYWHEAYLIWSHNELEGAGAGGFMTARREYRRDPVDVRHTHGYVPQTAADLGLTGLLISLAGVIAWLIAARRSTMRPRPGDPESAEPIWRTPSAWSQAARRRLSALAPHRRGERVRTAYARGGMADAYPGPLEGARIELLTLVAVVLTFGLHSAIDWTWAFPGVALIAVVAAGYVAGHGPLGAPGAPRSASVQARAAAAAVVAIIALVCVWAIWQPQRSAAAVDSSSALLTNNRVGDALLLAKQAVNRDPVAAQPLYQWAQVESRAGHRAFAVRILQQAVRLQPRNPDTWQQLASFQLNTMNNPSAAFAALRAALQLDPRSPLLRQEFATAYARLPRPTLAEGRAGKGAKSGKAGKGQKGALPTTAAGASPAEIARCRAFVPKAEAQLRNRGLRASKAAKKREKISRCQAVLRQAGG
jgi:tetratricopeptide (TPR) repeat protein